MQKLHVTEHKNTYEYELYDSSDSPGDEHLKITQYSKGKYIDEERVDLGEISPEFYEDCPDSQSSPLMMLLVYCGGFFFFLVFLAAILFQLFEQKLLVPIHEVLSCTPLGIVMCCWNYIRKHQKKDNVSKFVFEDEEETRIIIPYSRKRRSEILQFVRKISACCNLELLRQQQLPIVRHQFANGLAELRDNEIVLFNSDGVKTGKFDYTWCEPGTEMKHYAEKHWIKNFFCIFFAALSWFGPLALIIKIIGSFMDFAMAISFGMIYIIPFGLGCYFLSMYQKSRNYYFAGSQSAKDDDWYIYLVVDKNPSRAKYFIDELNRRLRGAKYEIRQAREMCQKIVIQQPDGTDSKPRRNKLTVILHWIDVISITISLICLFMSKYGKVILLLSIIAVILCLIFEHLTNWLDRRKKHKDS